MNTEGVSSLLHISLHYEEGSGVMMSGECSQEQKDYPPDDNSIQEAQDQTLSPSTKTADFVQLSTSDFYFDVDFGDIPF